MKSKTVKTETAKTEEAARPTVQETLVKYFRLKPKRPMTEAELIEKVAAEIPWSNFVNNAHYHVTWYANQFRRGKLKGQTGPEEVTGFIPARRVAAKKAEPAKPVEVKAKKAAKKAKARKAKPAPVEAEPVAAEPEAASL